MERERGPLQPVSAGTVCGAELGCWAGGGHGFDPGEGGLDRRIEWQSRSW